MSRMLTVTCMFSISNLLCKSLCFEQGSCLDFTLSLYPSKRVRTLIVTPRHTNWVLALAQGITTCSIALACS